MSTKSQVESHTDLFFFLRSAGTKNGSAMAIRCSTGGYCREALPPTLRWLWGGGKQRPPSIEQVYNTNVTASTMEATQQARPKGYRNCGTWPVIGAFKVPNRLLPSIKHWQHQFSMSTPTPFAATYCLWTKYLLTISHSSSSIFTQHRHILEDCDDQLVIVSNWSDSMHICL